MRNPFKSKFRVTQVFKNNPTYYGQFGLAGHEGLDLVPTGTQLDVLALEDGVVVKDDDVAGEPKVDAYGINVTIWHTALNKATQYCHLSSNTVSLGELVTKGQTIGYMGGTGNTNGAHLHLNLFDVDSTGVRLNRDNGFLGGTDPLPWLEADTSSNVDVYTELDKCRVSRDSHWNDLDAIKNDLGVPGEYSLVNVRNRINSLLESERELGKQSKLYNELNQQLSEAKTTGKNLEKDISDTKELLRIANEKIADLEAANRQQLQDIEDMKNKQPNSNETVSQLIVKILEKILVKFYSKK